MEDVNHEFMDYKNVDEKQLKNMTHHLWEVTTKERKQ